MDRRQFSLLALTAGLATGLSACGRRGPLEPPPYTAQGQEWARRSGRSQQQGAAAPQGSVREAVAENDAQSGTVDVEAQIERNRSEGEPQVPSDPIQSAPGTSSIAPSGSRRRPPGIVPPKRSFILDPLLE